MRPKNGVILNQPEPPKDPFLELLLKGGIPMLSILQNATDEELTFAIAEYSREILNVQTALQGWNGNGSFLRGLIIGMTAGILTDPNVLFRDVRAGLLLVTNDRINVLTGEDLTE